MRTFLLLFIAIPILEMVVLIKVGSEIGALSTVALVVLTAFIGVGLLKEQGLSTLFRARERMQVGEIPAKEMFEGIVLAIGGALLLTPGFITDTLGFLCLIPPVRHALILKMISSPSFRAGQFGGQGFQGQTYKGSFTMHSGTSETPQPSQPRVLEGEYRRDDD